MDNKFPLDHLSVAAINTSNMELPSIVEQNYETFVPKIRIRLRPNSEQSNSSSSFSALIDKSCSETGSVTKIIKNDSDNCNSETKCYKLLEDSGGGGGEKICESGDCSNIKKEVSHSYMAHGINLRARLPKPSIVSRKLKRNEVRNEKGKCNTAYQTEKDYVNKPSITSICTKNPYKSYILNSSKNHRKKENSNRKSISKLRNDVIGNINLKDIINHENFLKFSSEVQWQLANLLPNCDKPKSPDNQNNCLCSDLNSTNIDEPPRIFPNVNFNALNNEFFGKALTKYSLKIGQSDLFNLLTSERENLRSRSLQILNDDSGLIDLLENGVKLEECDTATITNSAALTFNTTHTDANNVYNEDENSDIKPPDDIKSNSSVCSAETMEMNGTGNLFENIFLKIEQYSNSEVKFEDSCDRISSGVCCDVIANNNCDDANEGSSSNDKDSIVDFQCDKANIVVNSEKSIEEEKLFPNNSSPDLYHGLESHYTKLTQNLSIDTSNTSHPSDTPNEFDDTRRKRGRKRKCFMVAEESQIVPVKRSSRSTAGKRPARLDSESPPTSPNPVLNNDRKSNHNKFKKQKDRNRNSRKSKLKPGHSSDELDNIIKIVVRPKIHSVGRDSFVKYQKNCCSSPESLPTESDMSPLSKPSPNGSSVISNFCRSSLVSFINDKKVSGHVNSVQGLSPSWSCTSESTTPSVKSDYGHVQPMKTSPSLNSNTSCHVDIKNSPESESKPIQGMPPPRQTLTLAAMREKMRAKKLAKEDNRKDSTASVYQKVSAVNNPKNKRPKTECSSLLKEGDDESRMMDKLINSCEEYDELLSNSQDSLLEFFMGDDNYDFDGSGDQCSDISTFYQKPFNVKKSVSKVKSYSDDAFLKDDITGSAMKMVANKDQCHQKDSSSIGNVGHKSKIIISKSPTTLSTEDQNQTDKSIADTIATVLQKLNASKENGIVANNNSNTNININNNATKTSSAPNAYLVDGNGLSNALSIIQSLNPGAKVTTQQFYLVNSGPQLILQPSPPASIVSDKNSPGTVQSKVSLAPKLTNQQSPIVRQLSSSTNNDAYQTITSLNHHLTFTHTNIADKPISLKMPLNSGDPSNTYMMSPISTGHSGGHHPTALHLQTISTPHPIGLMHSVQPSLPSLFSSQLRFVHPSLTNQNTPNTISIIPSQSLGTVTNHGTSNTNNTISNNQQSPKLLFLCPTVPNQTPAIVNQDQKYLLLSKQPDKQATIQLVSSQGLWQQLNPAMISPQSTNNNNLLLMPPQTITSLDSLLSSSSNHSLHNLNTDPTPLQQQHQHQQQHHKLSGIAIESSSSCSSSSSSSLIIDSRSIISDHRTLSQSTAPSGTLTNFCGIIDDSMTLTKIDCSSLQIDIGNNQHSQDIGQT